MSLLKLLKVGFQDLVVLSSDHCKTNFMHSFRLVRDEVLLEKTGPRFMINLQRAGGVVLLPARPEVGLGGRRSQKWHNDQK